MNADLVKVLYLVASCLFILGLKGLSHPRTAVRGNLLGALGMLLAIVVTLLDRSIISYTWILAGGIVGSILGGLLAQRVKMTAMPQMVALLNGLGGLASALVAAESVVFASGSSIEAGVAIALSGLIGAVTFTGSLVAFGKLQELVSGNAILIPARHLVNLALFAGCIATSVWVVRVPDSLLAYSLLTILAFALGILLVIPIGGADMPVVIALLNAYSGLAAGATGFVIDNSVLIVSGSLVGSSGIILSQLMCKAMNRSLVNVLFGGMAASAAQKGKSNIYEGRVKSTSAEETAMLLGFARRVVIVPGYGLAVAQAQHAIRELTQALQARDVQVEFGIHPVAGRMPGHMNVLLAEAEIPYESMKDMDEINPTFSYTDVVVVVGANDVVNPLARTDLTGPIGGMPILNVDEARTVIVLKRSLSPGYAGIDNPLFASDKTLMLFADARDGILAIKNALLSL